MLRRSIAIACNLLLLIAPAKGFSAQGGRTATLRWSAPGDDGTTGTAVRYDLRYSSVPLTEHAFIFDYYFVTAVSGLPAPGPAGSTQTFVVPGLQADQGYYFAIRTLDNSGNWSSISNIAYLPPQTPGVDVGDTAPPLQFSAPWPNPARSWMRCAFTLPTPMKVQIDVFDVSGRHVRALVNDWHPAGHHDVDWDLRDRAGRIPDSGTYLVRARLGDHAWTRRLTIVR